MASRTIFKYFKRSNGCSNQTRSLLNVKFPVSPASSLFPNFWKINLNLLFLKFRRTKSITKKQQICLLGIQERLKDDDTLLTLLKYMHKTPF